MRRLHRVQDHHAALITCEVGGAEEGKVGTIKGGGLGEGSGIVEGPYTGAGMIISRLERRSGCVANPGIFSRRLDSVLAVFIHDVVVGTESKSALSC